MPTILTLSRYSVSLSNGRAERKIYSSRIWRLQVRPPRHGSKCSSCNGTRRTDWIPFEPRWVKQIYMRYLVVARRKLGDTNTAVSEIATLAATGGSLASAERAHFQDVVDHLQKAISDAVSLTQDVERFLDQLSKLEGAGEALTRRLEKLREEMEQVYELIGIGLTAETLTHEINNVATHLSERSDRMARHLRAERNKNTQMLAFTETVKSSVAAMRRQLLFLAPSLQYVREKREDLDMYRYLNEIAKHYIPIFVNEHISLRVQTSPAKSFAVSINKGKLTQIIDNLLMNSEYWLNEDIRLKRIPQGQIFISFDKPFLRISDNGRGVDPTIEDSIFEPFVSAKGRGKGRGLGLYIAKQLLESEGCSIRLARNVTSSTGGLRSRSISEVFLSENPDPATIVKNFWTLLTLPPLFLSTTHMPTPLRWRRYGRSTS